MRRRALLGSAAGVLSAGVAGCLTDTGSSGPATTSTDADSTDSSTTEEGATSTRLGVDLAVTLERHQPNVAVLGVDSVGVRPDGYQYLFYHVDVTDGEPPARTDFGFRYGGQVYSPGVNTAGTLQNQESADRYAADRGEGWLVFELPAERPAEHAALALGGEEWPVSETTRRALSAPAPELELHWDAPAEQPAGESQFGFDVTNDSDRDTWFVGGLNAVEIRGAHSPVAGIRRKAPAGETVSWTITHDNGKASDDPSVGDGEPDGEYVLHWTGGERRQSVSFVPPADE